MKGQSSTAGEGVLFSLARFLGFSVDRIPEDVTVIGRPVDFDLLEGHLVSFLFFTSRLGRGYGKDEKKRAASPFGSFHGPFINGGARGCNRLMRGIMAARRDY